MKLPFSAQTRAVPLTLNPINTLSHTQPCVSTKLAVYTTMTWLKLSANSHSKPKRRESTNSYHYIPISSQVLQSSTAHQGLTQEPNSTTNHTMKEPPPKTSTLPQTFPWYQSLIHSKALHQSTVTGHHQCFLSMHKTSAAYELRS